MSFRPQLPGKVECMRVICGIVVGDTRFGAMQISTAQVLGRDLLSCRRFDQWGPGQENGALRMEMMLHVRIHYKV